ncbi:MAG: DUF3788 family protein [Sedimentisphaerales bacterium]
MALSIFEDKNSQPDDAVLAKNLGRTKSLWNDLIRHITLEYEPVVQVWGFYKRWSLRLIRKKRTILYMIPSERYFICAFVFGEKATEAARESVLPKDVMKTINEARVYAEGRGFRLEVKKKSDVSEMKKLAAIKMAN